MPSVQGLAVRRPALRIAGRRLVVGQADARLHDAMVRGVRRPRARIQVGNLAVAGDLGPDDGLQGHLVLLAHDVEVRRRTAQGGDRLRVRVADMDRRVGQADAAGGRPGAAPVVQPAGPVLAHVAVHREVEPGGAGVDGEVAAVERDQGERTPVGHAEAFACGEIADPLDLVVDEAVGIPQHYRTAGAAAQGARDQPATRHLRDAPATSNRMSPADMRPSITRSPCVTDSCKWPPRASTGPVTASVPALASMMPLAENAPSEPMRLAPARRAAPPATASSRAAPIRPPVWVMSAPLASRRAPAAS